VNTTNGELTTRGPTGFSSISGLAYDVSSGTLFGITAGGLPADLIRIDLTTGAATFVGSTGLDRVGSIEFGPDGLLYGIVTSTGTSYPTYLVQIDTATGLATPVVITNKHITGLTSCRFIQGIGIPSFSRLGVISLLLLLVVVALVQIRRQKQRRFSHR